MKYIVEKVLRTDNGIFKTGDQIAVINYDGTVTECKLELITESMIFVARKDYIEKFAYCDIEAIEKMEV